MRGHREGLKSTDWEKNRALLGLVITTGRIFGISCNLFVFRKKEISVRGVLEYNTIMTNVMETFGI